MNADVESYIRDNCPWTKLPLNVKQILGNSQKEYENCVLQFSIKNQLRYRGNLVRHVKEREKCYYEELLRYSREHLMLYPYHLSDSIVTGMRITPFQYYISVMQDLMEQERSYDSLPNFTAADCLRLLGIGRNQYIELMNRCRSSKKFFGVRKKPIRELLPVKPVADVAIDTWWTVQVGYVTEDDIKMVSELEKKLIDGIIDSGPQRAGELSLQDVRALYLKGLIYLDVCIEDGDYIIVPPLEGFVMNRVLGDYLETLLYKIFVSIDEHTTVAELSSILQTDLQLVKNAVSIYCRLGFARKKGAEDISCHPSWKAPVRTRSKEVEEFINLLNTDEEGEAIVEGSDPFVDVASADEQDSEVFVATSPHGKKRIGFLFDSTLTAFLMMGNLSQGLKSHAVTMFEVGKLSDESMESFLQELGKVVDVGEGEAQRYFQHALTLRNTVTFLRNNPLVAGGLGLDLIRCESLQALESGCCDRLLAKNYELLVSMCPLSNEIRPVAVTSCHPPHLGPAVPEVSSVWFKLFLYALTGSGPPTLLVARGTRLRVLPKVFQGHERLLITTFGHDPGTVPSSSALPTLNDALCHSAVLIQGSGSDIRHVPFPFTKDLHCGEEVHPIVQKLAGHLDLRHSCGYITLARSATSSSGRHGEEEDEEDQLESAGFIQVPPPRDDWVLLDCSFGIPLFDTNLNRQVCHRLVDSQLFTHPQSLQELAESSARLSTELLGFIRDRQDRRVNPDGKSVLLPSSMDLPFPTTNLLFAEGILAKWDGS